MTLFEKKQAILFRLYDVDQSGFISQDDFLHLADRVAKTQGQTGSPRHAQLRAALGALWGYHAGLDKDGDGRITSDEWVTGRLALGEGLKRIYQGISLFGNALFDAFDKDGIQGLSVAEYKSFLISFGFSPDNADQNFRQLDQDGNGLISRKEFMDLLLQFHYSNEESAVGNLLFGPLDL